MPHALLRSCCCARAANGHAAIAPEQRNELARFQLIELHSVPAAGWQDIELGWISQRLFGSPYLNPPKGRPCAHKALKRTTTYGWERWPLTARLIVAGAALPPFQISP